MANQAVTLTEIKRIAKDKNAYNILSALRGPDARPHSVAYNAKQMTTAVIRHLLGLRKDVIEVEVRSVEEAQGLWTSWSVETKHAVLMFLTEEGHFRSHLREAFAALSVMRSSQARTYYSWLISEGIL